MRAKAPAQSRRRLLLPLLAAAHLAAFAFFGIPSPLTAAAPVAIAISNLPGEPQPLNAIEPHLVPVTAQVNAPPIDIDTEVTAAIVPPAVPSGSGCALTSAVETSLRSSTAVGAALQQMPRGVRSVADAVLLWDGHWIEAASVGGDDALTPIRQAVAKAVREAPADCRDAAVTGPRMLYVATSDGMRVLAFGSGSWSWAQVTTG